MNDLIQRLTLIALTAGIATLAACGGGGGDTATTTNTSSAAATPSAAPAASTSAVQGKSLYQSHCASCHGGNPAQNISQVLKGSAAGNTLNAIAGDFGGMGYLSGAIGAAEANDIAAYLAHPNI